MSACAFIAVIFALILEPHTFASKEHCEHSLPLGANADLVLPMRHKRSLTKNTIGATFAAQYQCLDACSFYNLVLRLWTTGVCLSLPLNTFEVH